MKKVYQIVKYELIGKVLFTCQEMPELEPVKVGEMTKFFYKGTYLEYIKSYLWTLSTNPKEGALSPDEFLMPYFADVTEDINVPENLRGKLKPKTYKNCQLMTEKHGGYLQFFHPPTKKVLRIAMNSHYYTPIK